MSNDKALIRYMKHIDSLLAQIETLQNEVKGLKKESEEFRRERDWWQNAAMNTQHLVLRDKASEAK